MTASDFTVALFCRMDDALRGEAKHPLSLLHPSGVVTIGMLQALHGEGNRAFYRWHKKELGTFWTGKVKLQLVPFAL